LYNNDILYKDMPKQKQKQRQSVNQKANQKQNVKVTVNLGDVKRKRTVRKKKTQNDLFKGKNDILSKLAVSSQPPLYVQPQQQAQAQPQGQPQGLAQPPAPNVNAAVVQPAPAVAPVVLPQRPLSPGNVPPRIIKKVIKRKVEPVQQLAQPVVAPPPFFRHRNRDDAMRKSASKLTSARPRSTSRLLYGELSSIATPQPIPQQSNLFSPSTSLSNLLVGPVSSVSTLSMPKFQSQISDELRMDTDRLISSNMGHNVGNIPKQSYRSFSAPRFPPLQSPSRQIPSNFAQAVEPLQEEYVEPPKPRPSRPRKVSPFMSPENVDSEQDKEEKKQLARLRREITKLDGKELSKDDLAKLDKFRGEQFDLKMSRKEDRKEKKKNT